MSRCFCAGLADTGTASRYSRDRITAAARGLAQAAAVFGETNVQNRLNHCRRALALALLGLCAGAAAQSLPNPILFVTQFPVSDDFATIGAVFANHRGGADLVGRGGDLYIRYTDGSLRNLTLEAGFGNAGPQRGNAIAVRDPAVSWDGTRAVFSMVVGAPPQQFQWIDSYWQLYEVTGFGQGQTLSIVKVANQPASRNNINPVYLSDGSILFSSDRTRNGAAHLYPQLDEYESTPTPTGLWRLQPASGRLELLQVSPSGAFNPIVDSFGRVVFSRWDHLQRDQQNDDAGSSAFNWSSEAANSVVTADRSEVFPEPRIAAQGSNVYGYTINHFFPWMINQDGTEEETLNHVGRHELHSYFNRSINDPALSEFSAPGNRQSILNFLQLREDPTTPGRYYGIDAPEFYTHASGQLVRIDAAPSTNPNLVGATWLNPRSNVNFSPDYDPQPQPGDFTGRFRNPLPLSNGQVIAAHATEWREAGNDGTRANPLPRYQFRLKALVAAPGNQLVAGANLTPGISKSVSYWDPDVEVSYNGPMWELSPVEVRARAVPPVTGFQLRAPEQAAFSAENVNVEAFRDYLRANGLALLVVRNATTRDRADKQQPYNLRVPGGTQTIGSGGQLYDIAHMQFFQADQIRGMSAGGGRRALAQPLHDGPAVHANGPNAAGPVGSTAIASDGSVAAFVPAQRALAWHSTTPAGVPVVRERYWISFQPGEIRACDGCHGVNQQNQANPSAPAAVNTPQALRQLLARWRDRQVDQIFSNGVEERR
jgi:Hydrazine synthase alpha subunit middle domain/WD40-like Beta Propeller Repeat